MDIKPFDAIIFDCDGVLVNSELIVQDIELEHLERHGVHYDRLAFTNRYTGTTDSTFFQGVNQDAIEQTGQPLPENFKVTLYTAVKAAFAQRLRAIEGAAQASRIHHRVAVASSSETEHLHQKLEITGLRHLFGEHIYSADAVAAGKPSPDIFLHAAHQLGANPSGCLVVEDSINGVIAGVAAGMTVVGFTGGGHCAPGHDSSLRDNGAHSVISHLRELYD